jgi:hypothetical protein
VELVTTNIVSIFNISVCFKIIKYFIVSRVVTENISSKSEFTFSSTNNTTVLITDLLDTFSLPESVICWGRDFSSNNSSKYRMVQLFNQSCCRMDYDNENQTLKLSNATCTNLGVTSSVYLPASIETLVAKITMLY